VNLVTFEPEEVVYGRHGYLDQYEAYEDQGGAEHHTGTNAPAPSGPSRARSRPYAGYPDELAPTGIAA
jgi:hypothetical protein